MFSLARGRTLNIDRIDHLVLTVHNIEQTCGFYHSVLGFKIVTFGQDRKALSFGNQKLNLHQHGHGFEPKAQHPTPSAIDLCFITETPLADVQRDLASKQIPIEEGPVERIGATGNLLSIYIRDPDHNLIEIANYVD